jgi:peptidoglycan/xylan/chitin deacetylase (PgdA/CDA1 family)
VIRSLVKATAAAALERAGVAAWIGSHPAKAALPLVIGYHRVVDDFRVHARGYMPSMLISTATLEKQLDWIGRRYEYADPDRMDRWLRDGRSGGRPVAVITFDDGYRDVYEQAFPLLKRKGIPAVVFVVTDLVGAGRLQIHDELYLLLEAALPSWRIPEQRLQAVLREAQVLPRFWLEADVGSGGPLQLTRALLGALTQEELCAVIQILRRQAGGSAPGGGEFTSMDWAMLEEMQRAGIRIGSHTLSHALLTNEAMGKVLAEVEGSHRQITCSLGAEPLHFAYPDGRFDRSVVEAVEDAGYCFGYTTCRHQDPGHPELTIPRRLLWENACLDAFGSFSPAVMSCQVNGVFDFAARCRIDHAA